MSRAAAFFVLTLLVLVGCGETLPRFSVDDARGQLGEAFDRSTPEVSIYTDAAGEEPTTWHVEFKLDGHRTLMEARFRGDSGRWVLDGVRETGSGAPRPWEPLGAVIGRIRQEAAARGEETMRQIEQLATLVERYALDHGNSYPTVRPEGLKTLLVGGGYTKTWDFDRDAWGNAIVYHGSPDGQAYLILSQGADGEWDEAVTTYFRNTDTGNEAYEGVVDDPDYDLIWATGSFVQRHAP